MKLSTSTEKPLWHGIGSSGVSFRVRPLWGLGRTLKDTLKPQCHAKRISLLESMASHFDPFKEAFALVEDGGWGGGPGGPGGLGKGGGAGRGPVAYGHMRPVKAGEKDGPLTCHFSLAPPTGGCGLALLAAAPGFGQGNGWRAWAPKKRPALFLGRPCGSGASSSLLRLRAPGARAPGRASCSPPTCLPG